MKHWTLRTRLTIWSVTFFAAAVLLLGLFTISLVHRRQIESLDAELQADLRSLLHEVDEHGPRATMDAGLKLDPATRWVIADPGQAVLYLSPELQGERFARARGGNETLGRWRLATGSIDGFTVRVARGFEQVEATVADVRTAYLLALPGLLLFVGGGAWWLVRSALRPVQRISEAARRITTEHLDERLPQPVRADELGQLTHVLNEMLARIDRGYRQAIRFTADASHELRTPLALIATGIEDLLRRRDLAPEVVAALGGLLDDNRRLTAVCQDLLVLARADAGRLTLDRQPHDLAALVEAAVEDGRVLAEGRDLRFDVRLPAPAEEQVDARYLTRILLNLISNAVGYNRDGGLVRIELAHDADNWILHVANTGGGIAPEQEARLFERFFRTDEATGKPGHGLGLSLSRELARAHGGELALAGNAPDWTDFVLTLPKTWPSPAKAVVEPERQPVALAAS